ncbi:MAG: 30S ribosomal protein S9 [Candidatus Pacebacteria bacterium]|jgi:small subunit ribosomal protein S9|nr:30S ribosomal protein S9 [Candidatus Paceibacterota bacterium]MDD4994450.1 30S ribosomal protein S9 [Candidatus Paceibacterota bacterium]MDD5535145.1 30S ribosomal protein S9 [Candidatus Paceibacterota bacterium]
MVEKKTKKTTEAKEEEKKTATTKGKKYIEAVGRRKEAVARVRLFKDKPGIIINEKTMEEYFPLERHHQKILSPLKSTDLEKNFFISVKVKGGGLFGQAEAIRLGISRCLVKIDEKKFKSTLRKKGFLTRDSRVVERKKYGLKKARKAAQWSKR